MINLDKGKYHTSNKLDDLLPQISVRQDAYQSIEVSPSSSRSTIVHSYSERSFDSETTEMLCQTRKIVRTSSFTPSPTPPKNSKSSRPKFRVNN